MKRLAFIAWILSAIALLPIAMQAQKITTFDVPGGFETNPLALSASGVVTGLYGDPSAGKVRGFLRGASGVVTTFDVADMNTIPTAINATGQIAGYYCATPIPPCNSFLRQPDGTITAIDIPDAFDVEATAIDASGQIAGNWVDQLDDHRAFVHSADGVTTTFDVNGARVVLPHAMNARGETVGFWNDGASARGRGFLRDADGSITNIDVPAALTTDTTPYGINSKGQIAGIYSLHCPFPNTGSCSNSDHGFLRETNGQFTTFDVPNSLFTVAVSLDSKGDVTGYYEDANGRIRGFLRKTKGSILTFAVPNAQFTVPVAMNSSGTITGVYIDGEGAEHGFIAKF